jgi:hypothetical protein
MVFRIRRGISMAISFTCTNPECGSTIVAAAAAAGTQVRCLNCGTLQSIPAGEPSKAYRPPERPKKPRPTKGEIRIQALAMPKEDSTGYGPMMRDCLKSFYYAMAGLTTMAVMAIVLALGFYGYIVTISSELVAGAVAPGIVSLVHAMVCSVVMIGEYVCLGYFLCFATDVILGALEGLNRPPNVPGLSLWSLFELGLQGIGIFAVYVFPVVTIPLLPLGLLALGYSSDNRCMNIAWAWRAACRRKGKFLVLWGMLLFWTAVANGGLAGIRLGLRAVAGAQTPSSGFGGEMLSTFLSTLLYIAGGAIVSILAYAMLRCIGTFGRHCPSVFEEYPPEASPWLTVAFVMAGVLAGFLFWPWTFGAILHRWVS